MTISYNWLHEYLPESIDPERLGRILTSVGLEVESLEEKEEVPGGLKGLLIGEVMTCEPHPNADKLKITTVNVGTGELLSIVCGAPNVASGQKVVIAPIGAMIFPAEGEPIKMKKAKIRGIESHGMICAEDEIGMGKSHDGILVLADDAIPGIPAGEYFRLKTDWVYEIGLTPNRMDAMSHLGVARDVVAYLNHHDKKQLMVKSPVTGTMPAIKKQNPFSIEILDTDRCQRYAGVYLKDIQVKESPEWLKKRLQSIGLKSINNIVDATNFILHETGQPLHAFDAKQILDQKIIVRTAKSGETLITLDEKNRTLDESDLLICHARGPMCIAGVFGGVESGVKDETTEIFLESAWFQPKSIRKTSFRHQLRTDAATRFEKGVDIGQTVNVLKRAASLIQELAGGTISGDIIDVYPVPQQKKEITLKFHYLKRLSGKNYHPDSVKKILTALSFEISKESIDEIRVTVPFSKPDIHLPADVVEEIMRIDGLDQIEIPSRITITPSTDDQHQEASLQEKASQFLASAGFLEILTNSITDEKWYSEEQLTQGVKLLNNLSAEHNILRPSLIESGLACTAFNLHRKNLDLQLFEFGKIYLKKEEGKYEEEPHLILLTTGKQANGWRKKDQSFDLFYLKGICLSLLSQLGIGQDIETDHQGQKLIVRHRQKLLFELFPAPPSLLKKFDIRQEVVVADIVWNHCLQVAADTRWQFEEIARFPVVERDLAIIVDKTIPYHKIESSVKQARLKKLRSISLFDVFEHERFGPNKKSMALHFEFQDKEKTLTDTETDQMMKQVMDNLEREVAAEIRK